MSPARMNFIKENANDLIQVQQVAAAVAISRRSLERKFRQIMNRTIYEEITRVRIEQISKMLLETKLSIGHIANALNFNSIEHLSRSFHREKGMSPQAYRKQYS